MFPQRALLKRTLPIVMQSVHAHRKPRWVPVAKSKIYRIPKRPKISEEERLELQRINNNYKTQMRAIRRFYYEEMIKEKSTLQSETSEMSQKVEVEEWDRLVKANEKWNAQVALEREERRKQELAAHEQHMIARMEAKDLEKQIKIEQASKQIRQLKEESLTFITPDNLDEAIEHALANPVDYNFAIDLDGNKFMGRDTPAVVKKEQKATV